MALVVVVCEKCGRDFPTPAHAKKKLCGCCQPRGIRNYASVPNLHSVPERIGEGVGIPWFAPGEGGELEDEIPSKTAPIRDGTAAYDRLGEQQEA